MADFDLGLFKSQLAETIVWCSRQDLQDYGKYSLRKVVSGTEEWIQCIFDEGRAPCIQVIFEERRKLLHLQNTPILPIGSDLGDGRLLAFFPDWSLFDGAADAESHGFIDHMNFPAWDTWVYYGSENHSFQNSFEKHSVINYLISWVPPQLVKAVDDAIRVNPEESIMWLTDVNFFNLSCLDLLKQEELLR